MTTASYTEIREQIGQAVAALSPEGAQQQLVELLATMQFELNRLKESQQVLLAALRTRDVLLHEQVQMTAPLLRRAIEIHARQALDVTGGLYDIEWDEEIAFRWTGPGHDTVTHIWLDRSVPILFEVTIHSYGDSRNRGSVTLTVDGIPAGLHDVGENRLRSDPLPVAAGSFCSEIVLHVPFLLADPTGEPAPQRSGRRRKAEAGTVTATTERTRGIALRALRFLPATTAP